MIHIKCYTWSLISAHKMLRHLRQEFRMCTKPEHYCLLLACSHVLFEYRLCARHYAEDSDCKNEG